MARLEIEHIIPIAKGGASHVENLWLACPLCNRRKADMTDAIDPVDGERWPLFNPRRQQWGKHFRWSRDGLRIRGRTPLGRATVAALTLDRDADAIEVRSYWVLAGWHPPED